MGKYSSLAADIIKNVGGKENVESLRHCVTRLRFRLIDESIDRAIRFRKEIKRLREESDSWFFDVWQPENIGTKECWELKPEDKWHGFRNIDQEHMYLDPIKVTLLTPGLNGDGTMAERGIPASIVSKYWMTAA